MNNISMKKHCKFHKSKPIKIRKNYGKYKRENVTLIVIDIHFELYVISLGELKISVNPSRAV